MQKPKELHGDKSPSMTKCSIVYYCGESLRSHNTMGSEEMRSVGPPYFGGFLSPTLLMRAWIGEQSGHHSAGLVSSMFSIYRINKCISTTLNLRWSPFHMGSLIDEGMVMNAFDYGDWFSPSTYRFFYLQYFNFFAFKISTTATAAAAATTTATGFWITWFG